MIHADGRAICVADIIAAEADESGKVVVLRSLTMDITQQRAAQVQLEESEERFRLVADAVLDGIMIHQEGILVYVIKTALQVVRLR